MLPRLLIIHFFAHITNKNEKTLKKASAAKIASLAAFLQVRSQLFFRQKKVQHYLYFCIWSSADEGPPYDYRKNCLGMRQSRISKQPEIPVIV